MYCPIHLKTNCIEYHGSYGAPHCERCEQQPATIEALCRTCYLRVNDSNEWQARRPTCNRGCSKPVYSEGLCYSCWFYR